MWAYESNGILHGVPLANFLGWVLSATVTTIVLDMVYAAKSLRNRLATTPFMLDDVVSFILLWGIINIFYLNIIPSLLSVLALVGLVRTRRFAMPAFHLK